MKLSKLHYLALIGLFGFVAAAKAQHDGIGLGLILGEPTGLTGKYWVSETTAIDAAVGWSFEGRSSLHLHGDYLFHDFEMIPVEKGQLPLYAGIGGRLKVRESQSDRLGVRVPLGMAYLTEDIPLEGFVEIVPVVDLVPSSRVGLNAAIGVRYYLD